MAQESRGGSPGLTGAQVPKASGSHLPYPGSDPGGECQA